MTSLTVFLLPAKSADGFLLLLAAAVLRGTSFGQLARQNVLHLVPLLPAAPTALFGAAADIVRFNKLQQHGHQVASLHSRRNEHIMLLQLLLNIHKEMVTSQE